MPNYDDVTIEESIIEIIEVDSGCLEIIEIEAVTVDFIEVAEQGPAGPPPDLTFDAVVTAQPGGEASASVVPDGAGGYRIGLTLPQGPQGESGEGALFDPALLWQFDADVEGWTGIGATLAVTTPGWLRLTHTIANAGMSCVCTIAGAKYPIVKTRIRRLAGSGWDGKLMFSTSGHGFSTMIHKTLANPNLAIGQSTVLEFDMQTLTAGGADWIDNIITGLRLDLGNATGDQFEIDYIVVGRLAPVAPYVAPPDENALTINRGDDYPLRAMTRAGVTSAASSIFNNLFLKIRVVGATSGEYYRIAYQQNGSPLHGDTGDYGWIINAADAATYAETGTVTTVVADTDPAPAIDLTAGIQTIRINSVSRPGLQFVITLDPSALPAYGTAINANSSNLFSSWSWIIDPSCYELAASAGGGDNENALTINRGDDYPLRAMTRAGVTSAASSILNNLLLKIRVVGATAGEYYRIAYQQNGSPLHGDTGDYGWIINAADAATYAETGTVTTVVADTDPAPAIDLTAGIQTIRVNSVSRPGLQFVITLDPSALPAYGTAINANSSNIFAAWSWIIDPSCYELAASAGGAGSGAWGEIFASVDVDAKSASFAFAQDDSRMMRITVAAMTANALPTVYKSEHAPLGDPTSALWTTILAAGGDWFPPMIVEALSDGDGHEMQYTGGGHLGEGPVLGLPTARMVSWSASVDGRELGSGEVHEGGAESITLRWVNELMAFNSISVSRYVVRQTFVAHLYAGGIECYNETEALESIRIHTENGPQMQTIGFQESVHFWDGIQQARIPWAADYLTSGTTVEAPNAWAIDCYSPTNGHLISWIDDTYGLVAGRPHVGPNNANCRMGGPTNFKMYHAVVASLDLDLLAGDQYQWRGGYAWSPASIASGPIDSAFFLRQAGQESLAYAALTTGTATIPLPASYVGKRIGTAVVGVEGLEVSTTGYATDRLAISDGQTVEGHATEYDHALLSLVAAMQPGDLIYQGPTGPAILPAGPSGALLTMGAAGPVWSAPAFAGEIPWTTLVPEAGEIDLETGYAPFVVELDISVYQAFHVLASGIEAAEELLILPINWPAGVYTEVWVRIDTPAGNLLIHWPENAQEYGTGSVGGVSNEYLMRSWTGGTFIMVTGSGAYPL